MRCSLWTPCFLCGSWFSLCFFFFCGQEVGEHVPRAPARGHVHGAAQDAVERPLRVGRAGLVGADAQPVLKSRAKGMFGEGMSVMHLLEVDGRSPSSFLVADEKRLRSQIDQA